MYDAMTKKLKDNTKYSRDGFRDIREIVDFVVDKTVDDLINKGIFIISNSNQNGENLSLNQMILRSENESYRTGNIMGFLGCGEKNLIISSRFSDDNDYFLLYMLMRVLNVPNVFNCLIDASVEEQIVTILVFCFPVLLSRAVRKGLYRVYTGYKRNDNNFRGTVDIKRHLKENTPFLGKVAYNERIYSPNNYVMQLIRHVIELIRTKPYGFSILDQVRDEVALVMDATRNYSSRERTSVLANNKNMPVRHAYYSEYYDLQQLCISILQNDGNSYSSSDCILQGVLVDGAWLWEEYVNILIGESFYHPQNRMKRNTQYLFEKRIGEIYPDFIGRIDKQKVIADAKYKYDSGIYGHDYLQVLAYMFRFEANTGFFLYPDSIDNDAQILTLGCGSTFEKESNPSRDTVRLIKLGLKIPQYTDSFGDFVRAINNSERCFVSEILSCM